MGLKLIREMKAQSFYRQIHDDKRQRSAYLLLTEHLQQTIVVDAKVEVLQTPRVEERHNRWAPKQNAAHQVLQSDLFEVVNCDLFWAKQ